ncbi:S8 family peptidase [Paenibacillus durus]|uniref:Peptidase S8/S53 domain-containing protein n=1 Tax=Paenibacillus durus TaxID=44251 RepID=A0A089HJE5_PAEDU|nr:S8 family serine peptidase [Paenibacillus durus]AIQ10800.1 hypothetical protein PDUR_01260 [Paenibacillus durus]
MRITLLLIVMCLITIAFPQEKTFVLTSVYNGSQLKMLGTNYLIIPIKSKKIKKIKIGIIDVGITKHPNLNIINLSNSWSKEIGHGSIVSAIIGAKPTKTNKYKGLIPGIQMYSYNLEENFTAEKLINGIKAMLKKDVDVISLSVSTKKYNQELKDTIEYAISQNIVFVASAGNSGLEQELYPASYKIPGIISVGSLDNHYNISSYSTFNKNIDLFFPGEDILSIGEGENQISSYSGSSVAVPFITSIVALTKAMYPNLPSSEITKYLYEHTETYMAHWKNTDRLVRILELDQLFKE